MTGKYPEKDATGRFVDESKKIKREKCNEIIKAIKEFAEKEMGC